MLRVRLWFKSSFLLLLCVSFLANIHTFTPQPTFRWWCSARSRFPFLGNCSVRSPLPSMVWPFEGGIIFLIPLLGTTSGNLDFLSCFCFCCHCSNVSNWTRSALIDLTKHPSTVRRKLAPVGKKMRWKTVNAAPLLSALSTPTLRCRYWTSNHFPSFYVTNLAHLLNRLQIGWALVGRLHTPNVVGRSACFVTMLGNG